MINGILETSRGCLKEEIRMDIISNNLANINMIGFKKDRISFTEFLDQAKGGTPQPVKAAGGTSNSLSLINIQTDMEQGDTRFTGNPLDLAIYGKGFFKVNTPDGVRYTRKGNFALDDQGTIITQDGYHVLGKSGSLTVPGDDPVIDGQGNITVNGISVGQLDVVDFDDPKSLAKTGQALFKNITGEPERTPTMEMNVKQGYLELSNVNIAEEMISMIHSLRAFESYQKAIKVLDEMNSKAVNEVSRLR
ncbi:MAG: flagellar basal-body rod protein FlgF [Deltaproteobacteria bacterium]|nr:flagellar basal-body rod protein FlgF [Deltaproteobacteria bacterium]